MCVHANSNLACGRQNTEPIWYRNNGVKDVVLYSRFLETQGTETLSVTDVYTIASYIHRLV